ncbi:MAG: hypothetical protein ACRDJ0_05345 [Actinomycetota bacterium]
MKGRAKATLAWGLAAIILVGMLAVVVFSLTRDRSPDLINVIPFGIFVIGCGVVGGLVASRRSDNPIGWILCMLGVFGVMAAFLTTHGEMTPATPRGAEGDFVDWAGSFIWSLALAPLLFVLQLFPTGRPLSHRWRLLVWTTGLGLTLVVSAYAFSPGALQDTNGRVANPYGIDVLDIPLQVALWVSEALIVFSVVASVVSVIVRFRRSRGVERQQLKWFSYAGVVVVLNLLLQGVVLAVIGETDATVNLVNGIFSIAVTSIPITIGIAMLRYKLYDIDRIINRTIVYGGLSAVLALGYVGAVLVLQSALPVSSDSPLIVAASTLGMVALFRPLRNRIQGLVDRKFNRRRFDAVQTIDDFSARLRAETNLDSLSVDLVGVVRDTMQPAHVSLWLQPHAAAMRQQRAS